MSAAPHHVVVRRSLLNRAGLPLLLFLISCFALLVNLHQPLNVYDEGITAYGAQRVLNGDLPYKDFWTLYAPGQFYVIAGLFKLLGTSIAVERLWDTLVRSVLATLVFLISRKAASPSMAATAWLVTLLWLAHFGFYGYPIFPALALSMLSVLALLHYIARPQRRLWLVAAGVSAGLATTFRHDLGFYGFIAELLTLGLLGLVTVAGSPPAAAFRPRHSVTVYLLSVGAVLLLLALWLISTVPLRDLSYDLLTVPATVFPRVRALPYPPPLHDPRLLFAGHMSAPAYLRLTLDGVPFYFPLAVYTVGLIVVIRRLRSPQRVTQTLLPLALLLLVGLIALNQALIRSDLIHLPPTILPALILWSALHRALDPGTPGLRRTALHVVTIGGLAVLSLQPAHGYLAKARAALSPRPAVGQGPRRAGSVPVDPEQRRAIAFVQASVPPGEPIYVGNARHDQGAVNDVMFYFLAERRSATRYQELHPGVSTTVPVQREIIRDLRRRSVRCIVLVSGLRDANEPNESSRSSGVGLLDGFIRSNYQPAQTFGNYEAWMRR